MGCPFCGTECLIKLFDLQNHVGENDEGFNSIRNIARIEANNEPQDSHSPVLMEHLLLLLGMAQLLLILFVIGMYNINFVNEKFPAIARAYAALNITPERGITVQDFSLDFKHDNRVMVVDAKISNEADHCDLINSVQIIVFDIFNSPIAESIVQPNTFIKSKAEIPFKIQVTPMSVAARKVVMLINGKPKISKRLEK